MLKVFNAFQITAGFVLMPYGISWIHHNPFYASTAVLWAAIAIYIVYFFMMVGCVVSGIENL